MTEIIETPEVIENTVEQTSEVVESPSILNGQEQSTESVETEAPKTEAEVSDFISSLAAENRDTITQKGFKSADDVIKAYNNLESKFGKRFEDLTPDEVKGLNVKLGAPESVEGYKLNVPEDLKEDPLISNLDKTFLEAGVSVDQANKISESVFKQLEDLVKTEQVAIQNKKVEEAESLKKEFGSAFDSRVELANDALRTYGGDEVINVLAEAGLDSNPAIVKMLSEIGKLTKEDTIIGEKQVSKFGITPLEAEIKIAELMSDPEFVDRYRDTQAPGHDATLIQLEQLYKLKAGKR